MARSADSKKRASKLRQAEDDKKDLTSAVKQLTLIMKQQVKDIEELRARCSALYEANVKLSEEKARLSREAVLLKSNTPSVVTYTTVSPNGEAW